MLNLTDNFYVYFAKYFACYRMFFEMIFEVIKLMKNAGINRAFNQPYFLCFLG